MNIQLTPIQWFIVILLWISFGMVLDVLKLLVAAAGNTTSKAPENLKNLSHTGRIEIITVNPLAIELKVIKDIAKVFGEIKCSLLAWATNFLRQVIEPENYPDNNAISSTIIQPTDKKQDHTSYLVTCDNGVTSIFNGQPENRYAGQQIIGALVGFLALLAFLYADAAQGAQTFALLFEGNIPPFLNSIIIPLITASAGSALILGLFIGDILGLTHLGLFKKETPIVFRWVIFVNLVVSLLISTTIAFARMRLLDANGEGVPTFVNIAQSIVILPMLVTTFLLFRGISGVYVVLSFILSLFAIPFGIVEFFIRILADLFRVGIIGGTYLITRIIWLTLGSLEIVLSLLELAIKGSFAVLTFFFAGVFFIPHLIFRIVLRVIKQEEFYAAFLLNLTNTKLITRIGESEPLILDEPATKPEEKK